MRIFFFGLYYSAACTVVNGHIVFLLIINNQSGLNPFSFLLEQRKPNDDRVLKNVLMPPICKALDGVSILQ